MLAQRGEGVGCAGLAEFWLSVAVSDLQGLDEVFAVDEAS